MPSTRRWRGNAATVAQVELVTIHHVENGVTYVLTNGGKSVSVTATGSDTPTSIATALAAAWAASPLPQFLEITAANDADTLTLTANTAGVPFDMTATQSGTGGNVEIKTVTISHSPTGGTWSWVDSTYGTASGLAYNISSASLTTALEVIYGSGNVTATGSNGGPFTVTFGGTLAHVDIPNTTFVNTTLTGGDATVSVVETVKGSAGTDEVQTITFYGSPSGGTFTAAFNGFTTAALAYNISSANLQTALRGLASIGSTGVTVSGSAGGPYTVTFAGTLAGTAVDLITIDGHLLTGGTIFGTIATTVPGVAGTNALQYIVQFSSNSTDEVVTIESSGTVSGGTFKLSLNGGSTYSANISYDAPLYTILAALESLAALLFPGESYAGPYFAATYDYQVNLSVGGAGGFLSISLIATFGGRDVDTSGYTIDGALLTGGGSFSFPGPGSLSGTNDSGTGATNLAPDGDFYLTFGGQSTATMSLNASSSTITPSAATIQSALEGLSSIGAGNVTVTAFTNQSGGTGARGLWTVAFKGALAGTPVGLITGPGGVFPSIGEQWRPRAYFARQGIAGTSEVQTVTLSGTPSHGTFTLSFGGETTSALAYNASASDVDTALEALTTIPAGGVTCTGGALPGTAVTVTFSGDFIYTDVPQLVIDDTGLKSIVVETTPGVNLRNEVQTISLTGSPHGGTATLTYNAHTTSALAYNASASDVQAALIALSDFDTGDVVCTGGPWPAAIACTFGAAFAATDVAAITGTGTSLNNATIASTSVEPITYATTTANSGPNDIAIAANWSGETLPVAGDTVVFDQGNSAALWHLDQLATGLAAFYCLARYTGQIGLPEINTQFGDPYYEFRQQSLILDAPIVEIGSGTGNGSGRIKLTGVVGTAPTVNVYKTDTSLEDGIESLLLVLPNTSSVVNVNRGSVGIAIYPGETSTVPTLRVGFETNLNGDSSVRCGSGVTLTTIEQSGGQLTTNSNVTTVNMTDGLMLHLSGTFTTANVNKGTLQYQSTGTLTTCVCGNSGVLDMRQDIRAKTVTNLTLNSGSQLHDPHGVGTYTNGIILNKCTPADVVLDIRPGYTLTLS